MPQWLVSNCVNLLFHQNMLKLNIDINTGQIIFTCLVFILSNFYMLDLYTSLMLPDCNYQRYIVLYCSCDDLDSSFTYLLQ